MAAKTWIEGLPERAPNYGTDADKAYQVFAAGKPERKEVGADGKEVWADGFRPADGAFIDAKNVRKQGCSPRSLKGIQEDDFRTGWMLTKDEDELQRYKGAIDTPRTTPSTWRSTRPTRRRSATGNTCSPSIM
ncbi:restriction endonuclease fold toxin-2 domain-containing protein [Kitasatospora sp. NPDC087314]|uniref:restriction endonuclease fold toxin-2 domain-containing protein n=1 Tax=Kitasatospora sp. NPDC087314 TaxID=3364068 RepID=UPI00380DC52E